jgi:drug/metabolite transporter (DMT)-like permease
MDSKRPLTYGGIILANLFWALSFVGYKVAYKYFEPMALIFLRMVIASAFLYLIIRLTGKVEKIRSEDRGRFLVLALLEPLLYFLGESYGMKLVSSTTGAVIVSTIPLLTPIAAWFLLREKVGWIKLAGIFMSFIGVCFVLIGKGFTLNAPPLGILLMFVAVISAVLYTGVINYLAWRYKSLTIILMQSFLGAIYFLPIFLLTDLKETLAIQPSWEAVLPLLFLSIFPSSLSFILYTKSIREIGITRTNVFANFIPVFTAIFSYFILRESFTAAKIIGIPLVLAGLFLAQIRIRKMPVP